MRLKLYMALREVYVCNSAVMMSIRLISPRIAKPALP